MATFDYTSRDYSAIRQDLINRAAKTIPEWNSNDTSEFGNMFIDLWAYMGDILHYYVDRAAGETFLNTATQRDSILAIANLMDYIPASRRSARGTISISLTTLPTGLTELVIPAGTVFSGADANGDIYNFYTVSDSAPLTTGSPTTTVTVVQGNIISSEILGTSNGLPNQKFIVSKKNVDYASIAVSVYEGAVVGGAPTAVTYSYVSQLSTSGYLDKVFTSRVLSDNSTQILFGNGFNGNIPAQNTELRVAYRTTAGAAGNLSVNSITAVQGTYSSNIKINSSSAMAGGADEESIESIRTNVARLYRVQDRAVSLQDYKDLTVQVPGVAKATATYSSPTVSLYPVPHQTTYPPDPTASTAPLSTESKVLIPITITLKEDILLFFTNRSMMGVTVSIPVGNSGYPANYVELTPIYARLKVHVLPTYVQSWVKDAVNTAVRDLLTFDKVTFGQLITIGDIYRAALDVPGVDYVEILNLNTTYSALDTVATVTNIQVNATKLPCFTDKMNGTSAGTNPAVSFLMVGGLTGSN